MQGDGGGIFIFYFFPLTNDCHLLTHVFSSKHRHPCSKRGASRRQTTQTKLDYFEAIEILIFFIVVPNCATSSAASQLTLSF